MSRMDRLEISGGIYHVIARGNNKEVIFHENIDKGYFIKLIKECSLSKGFEVFAYVLMNNHYHIVLKILDKELQEVMHWINNKYSKFFNIKYERVGHVFQGRYKSIPVQDERYLLNLIRYVHQNPVRAGIVENVGAYKWSSDSYYRKSKAGFVKIHKVLAALDPDIRVATKKYIKLLGEPEETDYSNLLAIGDEKFDFMCQRRELVDYRKRLDEILIETCVTKSDFELIKSGERKHKLTEYKAKYILKAKESNYSYKEIGANIGMTDSGVKDILDRAEKKLKSKLDKIKTE